MRVAPTMGTSNSRSECFRLGETPQWCTDCALLLFCDNQRVCKGVNRERDAILHADFPQQLGHMGFHCTLANAEGRPDFLFGPARDQQFQYFLLPVGKGGAAGRESNSRSGTYAFNDFLAVALAARGRGFTWIVPVDEKAPLRRSWLKYNVTRTLTELNLMAEEFPHRDVGIVLKGHAGSIFVWDIDKEGVTERMKLEIGQRLPETYVVQSRPETAPHKRHVYFRQTEYFASAFQKQVNAGDYDLKGFGGGQVVAEGCVRKDTGEVRVGNDLPVCDIPDWLTDWLKNDSSVLVAQITTKKRHDAKALARLRAGDLVPTGKRTLFLTNLASRLFENRVSRKLILEAVTQQCRERCEDGVGMGRKLSRQEEA